jgi:hypothetical protein
MATAPQRTSVAPARLLLASGVVVSASAAWQVIAGETKVAGILALAAGAFIFAGGRLASTRIDRMLEAIADRIWDVAIFGSLIWASRTADRSLCAAALVAFSTSSLAAYERTRGNALGYPIEEGIVTRAVRFCAVSIGLISGLASAGTWAAAGWCAIAVAIRASQVAKGERA